MTELQPTQPSYKAMDAVSWWTRLASPDAPEHADRAALAQLRRCHTPEDVILVPAFHELLADDRRDAGHIERLAAVAAVLAHVRKDSSLRLPRALGAPRSTSGDPVLHPARFRRLLQIETPSELMSHGVRLTRFLDSTMSVRDVAGDFYWWTPDTKRQWAIEYYQNMKTNKE